MLSQASLSHTGQRDRTYFRSFDTLVTHSRNTCCIRIQPIGIVSTAERRRDK